MLARIWRKGNHFASLVGMQIGADTVENSMETPQKISNRNTVWSSNSTSGYTVKGNEVIILKMYLYSHVHWSIIYNSQFSRVTQSCPTLWDCTDYSMSVFLVHCQLPELAQTHVHQVGDAIQPSHPLSSPSPPPPIPPSIRVFSNESTLRMRWPKYWTFSFSIIPSKEIPGLISLQSKGLSRVFSNTTVQKHQSFSAQLSL